MPKLRSLYVIILDRRTLVRLGSRLKMSVLVSVTCIAYVVFLGVVYLIPNSILLRNVSVSREVLSKESN